MTLQVTLVRGLAQLFLVEKLSLNYQQTIYLYNLKQPHYHWSIFYKNREKNGKKVDTQKTNLGFGFSTLNCVWSIFLHKNGKKVDTEKN
jgi:hypothetical protein